MIQTLTRTIHSNVSSVPSFLTYVPKSLFSANAIEAWSCNSCSVWKFRRLRSSYMPSSRRLASVQYACFLLALLRFWDADKFFPVTIGELAYVWRWQLLWSLPKYCADITLDYLEAHRRAVFCNWCGFMMVIFMFISGAGDWWCTIWRRNIYIYVEDVCAGML